MRFAMVRPLMLYIASSCAGTASFCPHAGPAAGQLLYGSCPEPRRSRRSSANGIASAVATDLAAASATLLGSHTSNNSDGSEFRLEASIIFPAVWKGVLKFQYVDRSARTPQTVYVRRRRAGDPDHGTLRDPADAHRHFSEHRHPG